MPKEGAGHPGRLAVFRRDRPRRARLPRSIDDIAETRAMICDIAVHIRPGDGTVNRQAIQQHVFTADFGNFEGMQTKREVFGGIDHLPGTPRAGIVRIDDAP